MSFSQIAWLPLCAGVTGVGLVLSFLLLRRRGAAAGLRGVAWSLLPLAAYLTGALPTVWQIGTAIVGFFTGLAFNPSVWAGVAVTGLVRGALPGLRDAARPPQSRRRTRRLRNAGGEPLGGAGQASGAGRARTAAGAAAQGGSRRQTGRQAGRQARGEAGRRR